jgi:lysophospholipase L1-like esterase
LAHVTHYAKRIVLPYRPRAIVLYAGENDLGWPSRKTPDTVLDDFKRFLALVQTRLPEARVYFISLKLSPFRRGRWEAMKKANRLVEQFARGHERVTFLDTTTAMLNAQGNPCATYQPWYRLHMTARGYALWTSIVRPVLEADLVPKADIPDSRAEPAAAADRPRA